MIEIIDIEEFNTEATAAHLQKGPFASIFEYSNEKTNPIALKLMCIIDYNTQRMELYQRMLAADPKLLTQLMQFHSYGLFKYYDYQVDQVIGKHVLKCKFCELIGPYRCIATHLAINHDTHIELTRCAYCNRIELKKHFGEDLLHKCYAKYLQQNAIQLDETVCSIVSDFYGMLKEIAVKFKISTDRKWAGKGPDYKNISKRCDALDREFNRVISNLYGGNNASRLLQQSINSNGNDSIIISSDDDGDVDNSASKLNQSRQSDGAAATRNQAECSSVSWNSFFT